MACYECRFPEAHSRDSDFVDESGAPESAFLDTSQVILMQMAHEPPSRNRLFNQAIGDNPELHISNPLRSITWTVSKWFPIFYIKKK